jgi:Ser/Thr protein kinase RdoA (MazF antagonist)
MQEALIAYISELYGIPGLSQKSGEVKTGTLSISSVLSNGTQKFFLKQYRESFTEERVQDVHRVKHYFNEGGIPVILPIKNNTGMTYFAYGGFLYALFPFIDEKHLDRTEMSQKAMESMATMLGKIHVLGKNPTITISAKFKPWDKTKLLSTAQKIVEIINAKKTKDEFDLLSLKNIETKVALVNATDKKLEDFKVGEPHLIHGDYHDHNIFINDNDEVTHVFDFEKSDMSPRTYELIRSMNFTCLDGNITDEKIDYARVYLNAYNTVYPISADEFKQGMEMYFMKTIHSLWVVEEYYLTSNYHPSLFLKKNMDMLMYMKDHREALNARLASILK